MNRLTQILQEIKIVTRLKFPGRRSCLDCSRSSASATGNGWDEARDYEWECRYQEKELTSLVSAYENVVGEVNYVFATVCPLYRKMTEAELKAESEC